MILEKMGEYRGTPFYCISLGTENAHVKLRQIDLFTTFPDVFSPEIFPYLYRAAGVDCLERVTTQGVDVIPTDAPLFCETLQKAMDYGNWPKVVMAFEPSGLEKTFREMSSDVTEDELKLIMETYPNKEVSVDGKSIWLSRLSMNDKRRATAYEIDYAWWIPGNPWDTLKFVLMIGQNMGQLEKALSAIK